MKNNEDDANDGMTNGNRTRLSQLQQEIHDALRLQHPDWVGPKGIVLRASLTNLVLLNCWAFLRTANTVRLHDFGGYETRALPIAYISFPKMGFLSFNGLPLEFSL